MQKQAFGEKGKNVFQGGEKEGLRSRRAFFSVSVVAFSFQF